VARNIVQLLWVQEGAAKATAVAIVKA